MAAIVLRAPVITRPANITAYSLNDVVAGNGVVVPQQMANASLAASGFVTLNGMVINTDQSTCQLMLRVHFWKASVTLAADNAAFVYGGVAGADETNYQGYLDMMAFGTEDAASTLATAISPDKSMKIIECATDKSFWFAFEAKGGVSVAPASGQKFMPRFELFQ